MRIYPRNEAHFHALIRQQRRAYNLAIACFREADAGLVDRKCVDLQQTDLRRTIREFVRSEVAERSEEFVSSWCDEAVNSAYDTRAAVIRKRMQKQSAGFSFKSRKDIRQSFCIQKLSLALTKTQFHASEPLPPEACGGMATVTLERGRWFISTRKYITTIGQDEIQVRSIVALDPGVRTFVTSYAGDSCTSYGSNFYANTIFPKLLALDALLGLRSKSKHGEWKRHYQKRIDRLALRIRDLVDDLHKRVAYDLVMRHDIILLPTFETSRMASKSDRKIRSKTVRSMLGLGHYRFQQRLKWMAQKYGKRLILVGEAYTSKTRSWDGVVHQNLGSSKTISDGRIVVDRDINGARGILLKALYGNLSRVSGSGREVAFVAA